MKKLQVKTTSVKKPFRFSLRYKVAFPILILAPLLLVMLFNTTLNFTRELIVEADQKRLFSIAEVFTESIKVPLVLDNQEVLAATLEWIAGREDVLEVRVEDAEGNIRGSSNAKSLKLPDIPDWEQLNGVHRIAEGQYVAVVPIKFSTKNLGRLVIVFAQVDIEKDLRKIFVERMYLAFLLGAGLALLVSVLTWLSLRPISKLQRTVQQILSGNLEARAQISSFDEIEDLGDAFNEMVSRLARSLDNLRMRSHALEESEAKYRLIVDNASDIIFAMTLQGQIVFLNEGFSGCPREDLLEGGLELFKDLHETESRERFVKAIQEVIETKESVTHLATSHFHKELQSEIFFLTNLTPLLDHNGQVKLIQGVMRDVTELKRVELMKESLIRDVAHELKTPTAKFEMAVNFFQREIDLHPELKKYENLIEMLRNNKDRLMNTITSIMDLTKLESGTHEISLEKIDLYDLLNSVIHDMEALCQKKGLSLVSEIPQEFCEILGDRNMLYRLFVNLINNAIKYSQKGTIRLKSVKEKECVTIQVKDEGIGIEDIYLRTIFDRFVQKSAASEGIGVGLTISRDIAILHHAKLWAESDGLGKGAVFKVKFPFGREL